MSEARKIIAEAIAAPWTDVPTLTRMKLADRILADLDAAGLAIVSKEPSEAMVEAGAKNLFQPGHSWEKCAADVWAAMLAVAPAARS